MYKILLAKTAEKEYIRLFKTDKPLFNRIKTTLHFLASNPHQGKPLKFILKGRWSYKVGAYHIIYAIHHNKLIVYVLDIGHRRDVYR